MEWTSLDVGESDDPKSGHISSEMKMGLDIDAEGMHRRFLDELAANFDVFSKHQNFIGDLASGIGVFSDKEDDVISLEELIEDMNGKMIAGDLCLHLPYYKEVVSVQIRESDGFQLVRMVTSDLSMEIFRTFMLPEGKRISSAYWEGDLLRMKIE